MKVLELSEARRTLAVKDRVQAERIVLRRGAAQFLQDLRLRACVTDDDRKWADETGHDADHVTVPILHQRLYVLLGDKMYPFSTFEKMMNGSDAMPGWLFLWVMKALGVPMVQLESSSGADWYLTELAIADKTAKVYRAPLRQVFSSFSEWLDLWRATLRSRPDVAPRMAASCVSVIRGEIARQRLKGR